MGILRFYVYALLWGGEPNLGWRAFVFFMVGVLIVALLFDEMARRAINAIRRERRASFVNRLMRQNRKVVLKLRRFLSRLRR